MQFRDKPQLRISYKPQLQDAAAVADDKTSNKNNDPPVEESQDDADRIQTVVSDNQDNVVGIYRYQEEEEEEKKVSIDTNYIKSYSYYLIKVDREVGERFKLYVLSKHGSLHGYLKEEAERALLYYISGGPASNSSSTNSCNALHNLDKRMFRTLAAIADYARMKGVVELPAFKWRDLVMEALRWNLRRKPDSRTVARYFKLVSECLVEKRANGTIWRFKGLAREEG